MGSKKSGRKNLVTEHKIGKPCPFACQIQIVFLLDEEQSKLWGSPNQTFILFIILLIFALFP